ncbi:prostaglandin G/H synthase 2-like [Littorina saxatilis]|uniref:prostaglandin-endoperoxide synthase n=1 Tax=Littorina saxatilis TaxID=31220 RepID=A0AAN9AWP9_9CAEN
MWLSTAAKGMWPFVVVFVCQLVTSSSATNPCCSYPCQNDGMCMTTGHDTYMCDCSNMDFYGDHCEHPTLMKRIKTWLRPDTETTHYLLVEPKYKWIWNIVNNLTFLSRRIMKVIYMLRADVLDSPPIYNSAHSYVTLDAAFNRSLYSRILPPVPEECPTPMGTKGPKELPDVDLLIKKFFTRTKFLPEPTGSNVLFSYFAQHFTHMFFKTDFQKGPGFQWGNHGVDMSNVYGKDKAAENRLRSFKGGKFKMQLVKGEEYPLPVSKTGAEMVYPKHVREEHKYALGHSLFGLLPGLFVYSTVWMREHNRVCGILAKTHPEWDDERLFQTGKLIILGETIKIVIEDYVQHLSSYNYQLLFVPDVLFGEPFQYQNRIAAEFNHLYHWHPLMPTNFNISGTVYELKDYMFHSELVIKHGFANVLDSMIKQRAGLMSHHNHGPGTLHVLRDSIIHQRQLRFQSLNNYRKRFNLAPYTTFEELTGETVMAAELEKLYHDVDAVEMYVGMIVEKRRHRAMFGSSVIEIGGPNSVKGLMSNYICSPQYWKPSTFGGEVGFDIVNTASMQKLFCQNIKGKCPVVSFRVPDYDENETIETWDGKLPHDEL